jgi:hypothetical protein
MFFTMEQLSHEDNTTDISTFCFPNGENFYVRPRGSTENISVSISDLNL